MEALRDDVQGAAPRHADDGKRAAAPRREQGYPNSCVMHTSRTGFSLSGLIAGQAKACPTGLDRLPGKRSPQHSIRTDHQLDSIPSGNDVAGTAEPSGRGQSSG